MPSKPFRVWHILWKGYCWQFLFFLFCLVAVSLTYLSHLLLFIGNIRTCNRLWYPHLTSFTHHFIFCFIFFLCTWFIQCIYKYEDVVRFTLLNIYRFISILSWSKTIYLRDIDYQLWGFCNWSHGVTCLRSCSPNKYLSQSRITMYTKKHERYETLKHMYESNLVSECIASLHLKLKGVVEIVKTEVKVVKDKLENLTLNKTVYKIYTTHSSLILKTNQSKRKFKARVQGRKMEIGQTLCGRDLLCQYTKSNWLANFRDTEEAHRTNVVPGST